MRVVCAETYHGLCTYSNNLLNYIWYLEGGGYVPSGQLRRKSAVNSTGAWCGAQTTSEAKYLFQE